MFCAQPEYRCLSNCSLGALKRKQESVVRTKEHPLGDEDDRPAAPKALFLVEELNRSAMVNPSKALFPSP